MKRRTPMCVYYGDDVHLDYWTNHSLPVILVGHIPDTMRPYGSR